MESRVIRWPAGLDHPLDEQRGLLTRAQALAAGVSRSQLRWAVGRDSRLVLPGVIATFTGDLDAGQRLIAGQLWAGPGSQLASLTAVRWHQLGEVPDDGGVRLLVDWGQGSGRSGFAVRRRTTRLDPQPWRRGVLRVCSRPRALIDAARELREPRAVRQLLVSATQRRLVREDDLRAELESGPVRGSRVTREALREVATGAWSSPEVDVLAELARSRILPRVWPNPILVGVADGVVLPSPDFWLDEVALAGQIHSRSYHLRDDHWESTVMSDTVFGEYDVAVVSVTPTGFARAPCGLPQTGGARLRVGPAGRRAAVGADGPARPRHGGLTGRSMTRGYRRGGDVVVARTTTLSQPWR